MRHPRASDRRQGSIEVGNQILLEGGQHGEVDPAVVANLAAQAQRAGVAEVGLGDTIGVATPWDVRRVIDQVRLEAPDVYLRLHFHDTRGAGLANVAAAVEVGIDVIDASCGGIGGCPFAPAATGNVATEDVVYMLERAGFDTGRWLPLAVLAAVLAASAWATWALADNGFPSVGVWFLNAIEDEIVIGTHGRGIWSVTIPELDDGLTFNPLFDSMIQTPSQSMYRSKAASCSR